jgi:hypothetical protein
MSGNNGSSSMADFTVGETSSVATAAAINISQNEEQNHRGLTGHWL